MKDKRRPGQSQLDYLWVNYGGYSVSSIPSSEPDVILTQEAITSILKEFKNVTSVQILDKNGVQVLEVKTSDGKVTAYSLPASVTITNFTKRKVTQYDKDNGCTFPIESQVYSILLSNGAEYLAPIDNYKGKNSSSIILEVLDNTIQAELQISNKPSLIQLGIHNDGLFADLNISQQIGGISFQKLSDGLQGNIILQNTDKFIKFSLVTSQEYSDLAEVNLIDDSTMYFIKGQKYFYFGTYKIGGTTSSGNVELDDYYTKQDVDSKLSGYATKDYVQDKIDANSIKWINI